jgi:hypothetical protein
VERRDTYRSERAGIGVFAQTPRTDGKDLGSCGEIYRRPPETSFILGILTVIKLGAENQSHESQLAFERSGQNFEPRRASRPRIVLA